MSRRFGKWWKYSRARERLGKTEEWKIGKEYESHIASKLTSFGFEVTDISLQTYKDKSGESRFYPFDLLAESPHYSLAIDVKYRRSKAPISIHQYIVAGQMSFDLGTEVDDRVYVFCTPGLADSYIKMSTLQAITEKSSMGLYILGGYYIIERHTTHSLTEIRKIKEVAHLL